MSRVRNRIILAFGFLTAGLTAGLFGGATLCGVSKKTQKNSSRITQPREKSVSPYLSSPRALILTRCKSDPENIGFPRYGVTNAKSDKPVLTTFGQSNCICFTIYDRSKKVGLLAHLTSGKSMYGTPPCIYDSKQYVSIFKSEFFRETISDDAEITIIATKKTPPWKISSTISALQKYFPGVSISLMKPKVHDLTTKFDTRTGQFEFLETIWEKTAEPNRYKVYDVPLKESPIQEDVLR